MNKEMKKILIELEKNLNAQVDSYTTKGMNSLNVDAGMAFATSAITLLGIATSIKNTIENLNK